MSSLRKFFTYGIALIAGALLFAGCELVTSNTSANVTWTAEADGNETAASTKIDFTFARSVAGLTAEQINVIAVSGRVEKGALTGSGINWSLAITVETAGNVVVKINRSGIDAEEQLVAVRKAPVTGWSAQANGTDGTTNSTAIAFTFDKAVAGLAAEDITIAEGTGKVAKGNLTGGGTSWSLGVTVETAGDVTVSITKDGVLTGAKNVAVYKAGETTALTWTAQADGGGGVVTSTYIGFTFSGAVTGLTAEQISLTADTGSVTKGELTPDGAEWKLGITVGSAGDIIVGINKDGIETTTRKVAVHKSGEMAIYSWTARANGAADTRDTTAIGFTFSGAVASLNADLIVLTDDTGAVTKGALTGSGTSWSLGVTVNTAGNIKVKIISGGIEAAEKTMAVYKVPAPSDITYDIGADGGDSTTSTKIDFTFDAAVEGLTAEHIILANGTGAATKGALTGGDKNWSLAITVATAGNVKVTISKAGIEAGEKTVTVRKAAPPVNNDDIVYDIAADGGASTTSTKINFTFGQAVTGLTAEQISVANDTGAATKGTLSGSGTSWALGISVTTPGKVKVTIGKAGIEDTEKTVEVYKFVPPPDATYTAAADGAANTTTSTKINFVFDTAVAGLTAGDISVANDTGTAAKGSITGSDTSWSLEISVMSAGKVKVKINKTGIEAAEKIVAIYKAPPPPEVTYTVTTDGAANTTDSTAIVFAFASAVEGLTAEQISLTNETGAVTKGTLSGSGTSYSLGIAVATAGTVKVKINKAGIEAAEKSVTAHKAPPVNNDLVYSVSADGNAATSSSKIDFVFAGAADGLTAGDITLSNDTGAVTKGALTGSETNYSLGITVATAGSVKVKINKAGIEDTERTVTVFKFIPPPDITYTATADGDATTSSTKINFVFNAAVAELVAGNISVVNGTGAVTKGTLTGNGANWSLGITVDTAGSVKVTINKTGIEDTGKTVTAYKAPSLTPEVSFGTTTASSDVTVGILDGDEDDPVVNMTISAVEKGTVYFTALKTADQTITPSGIDGSSVTVHTSGTVDGETADSETAVIAAKTGELPFDGGTSQFTLTVSDSSGGKPRTINVSLEIGINKTGAAAFKVSRDGSNNIATLERIDTDASTAANFRAAIEYVNLNAAADTEYLVRVENDETSLPRFILTFNNQENVTLRLRGTSDGPKILKAASTGSAVSYDSNAGTTSSTRNGSNGFFNIGFTGTSNILKKTFILGRNITIQGLATLAYSGSSGVRIRNAIAGFSNTTVILEAGSKITAWFVTIGSPENSVIFMWAGGTKLRLEEGTAITNCSVHLDYGLVTLYSAKSDSEFYKAACTDANPIFNNNNVTTLYYYGSELSAGAYSLDTHDEVRAPGDFLQQ
jgi:hypothetical protein